MNGNVLDHLWNGWRATYVSGSVGRREDGAGSAAASSPRSSGAGWPTRRRTSSIADATCFVIMNAFPYTSGHVMVLPYREVADLEELTADEAAELWADGDGGGRRVEAGVPSRRRSMSASTSVRRPAAA